MTVVMLLYRTDLPPSVKTRPWHIRVKRLPKLPEELQLLLIAEHHLSPGGTLELEDEVRLVALKLVLDLRSNPIKPSGEFLLIPAREPDTRALLDLRLYDNGAVGHPNCRYASNDVLLIFHVAGGFGSECKRYGAAHPVAILNEGRIW